MESMARPDSLAMIDTVLDGSVSFAPPDPSDVQALEMARSGHSTGTVDGADASARRHCWEGHRATV